MAEKHLSRRRVNRLVFLAGGTSLVLVAVLVLLAWSGNRPDPIIQQEINGERALRDVEYQVSLGPRIPESTAHRQTGDWIVQELKASGWQVDIQQTTNMDKPIRNIVARFGSGSPWLILGAHYDSRLKADRDPDPAQQGQPVPGANDGASGVAVLLELGRVLPGRMQAARYHQVWLVFFDAEDNGRIPGWDWILGSRAFVSGLQQVPDAAVIVDMIGDADLNIYQEKNSDPAMTDDIWAVAQKLGYSDQFIPQVRHQILDDHIPFLQAGIPAVDLIDFDYPYWHTLADTSDKISAASLDIVGEVLLTWITEETP